MKNRVLTIAVLIAVFAALSVAPRAQADPLTIMAVVGLATVIAASSVDIIASDKEDFKEMRAQEDATDKLVLAKVEKGEKAAQAAGAEAPAQP